MPIKNTADIIAAYDNLTGCRHFQDPDTGEWVDEDYDGVFYINDKPHYLDFYSCEDADIVKFHKKYGKPFDEAALNYFKILRKISPTAHNEARYAEVYELLR